MRPLGDRISGDPRGAHRFGSCRMTGRFGLQLPRAAARVWASQIGASREHVARRKRRSTSCGRQNVRRHLKSGPVQNTVPSETGRFCALQHPSVSHAQWQSHPISREDMARWSEGAPCRIAGSCVCALCSGWLHGLGKARVDISNNFIKSGPSAVSICL